MKENQEPLEQSTQRDDFFKRLYYITSLRRLKKVNKQLEVCNDPSQV